MPRMPTEESLGFNLPRSQDVPRQRRDIIGEAVQQGGAAISRAGQVVSDEAARNLATDRSIALKKQGEDDALDLARARAAWTKRRLTEDDKYQLENDPDYSKWEKGYAKNIEEHRKLSAGIIRNPKLREKFEIETSDDVVAGTLSVRNRAKGIDRETKITEALQGLDDSINLAARPGTDPKTANAILGQARANIDNMLETGIISPGKALDLRRDLAKRYAKAKVGQDIKDDPLAASSWLEGGKGGAMGLIRRFEGYRARPYWDSNHYRVGFGSDTVTLEDGTILKVRPGMEINRADAERDLNRRIGEFQKGIAKDIGSDAWARLPEPARDALTSVAYNYGSLPASVVTALKTRDLGQVAEAVRGLGSHNGGINAKRRNQEADIIATGEGMGDLATPDYYSVLDIDERMSLQAAADGEWAARQKEVREATALERYKITQAIDNDITQIRETGQATDLDPQTVVTTLGDDDAAKWLEKRQAAADTFSAVSVMDSMDNDQIEEHLAGLEPKPGAENFARSQDIYDAAEKRAKALLDLRLKDPAKSVEDSPLVKEAKVNYNPEKPESIQGVIGARLAAQSQVGVPKAMQQPVTRKEAYAIIAPVQSIIDQVDAAIITAQSKAKTPTERRAIAKQARKQAEDEIRATIDQVEQIYGPYAQDVLAFAIAESVRDKEIGNLAAGIYRKIAKGEAPSFSEITALDNTVEASAAEKAMNGETLPTQAPAAAPQPAEPAQAPLAVPGRSGAPPQPATGRGAQATQPKPPPGGWPFVDENAVQDLIKNPWKAQAFDAKFGPGAAAEWLPKPAQE